MNLVGDLPLGGKKSLPRNPMERPDYWKEKGGPCPKCGWPEPWPGNPVRLASSISAVQGQNKHKIVVAISRGVVVIDDSMRMIYAISLRWE